MGKTPATLEFPGIFPCVMRVLTVSCMQEKTCDIIDAIPARIDRPSIPQGACGFWLELN